MRKVLLSLLAVIVFASASLAKDAKWEYYTHNTDPNIEYKGLLKSGNIIFKNQKGKAGLISKDGKVIVPPIFNSMFAKNSFIRAIKKVSIPKESNLKKKAGGPIYTNDQYSIIDPEKGITFDNTKPSSDYQKGFIGYLSYEITKGVFMAKVTNPEGKGFFHWTTSLGKAGITADSVLVDKTGKVLSGPYKDIESYKSYDRNYILVKGENNLWGAVSKDGTIQIIPCEYAYKTNSDPNFIKLLDANKELKDRVYVFALDGKKVGPYKNAPRSSYFDKFGLDVVKKGDKYVLLNKDLKEIMTSDYYMSVRSSDRICKKDANGKVAICDLAGNKISKDYDNTYKKAKKEYLKTVANKAYNNKDLLGLINIKTGEELLPPEYLELYIRGKDIVIIRKPDEKSYIFNPVTKEKIGPFTISKYYGSGLIVSKKDGKFGYINKKGTAVIPYKYDFARTFYKGVGVVKDSSGCYLINTKGEKISAVYPEIDKFHYNYVKFKQNGKYGFLDRKGNVVFKPIYDEADEMNKYGWIDAKIGDKKMDLYRVDEPWRGAKSFTDKSTNKQGIKNMETGEIIIPAKFDEVGAIETVGYVRNPSYGTVAGSAMVKKNGIYQVIIFEDAKKYIQK